MQLALPASYVEIEQEEMMYLDGGFDAKTFLYTAIGGAIVAFIGRSVKHSIIGAVVRQAGWWLTTTINSAIVTVGINPFLGTALAASAVAGVYLVGQSAGYWD